MLTPRVENEVLTTQQAAKLLGVVPLTVRRMIKKGRIRASKRGRGYRIRRAELDVLLEGEARVSGTYELSVALDLPSPPLREWAALYLPMFKEFVEHLLTSVKPSLIILLDRKGARTFELMELIPKMLHHITFSENAFKFKDRDSLKDEVAGKAVLILDELAQYGRQIAKLRETFENAGAEVVTACLLRRRAYAESGKLLDPKIHACVDGSDRAFAYHATMISQFVQVQGDTLDHDHVAIKFVVPGLRNRLIGILRFLTELGSLYFVAPDTQLGEIVPVTIDNPFFLRISQLPKKWLVFDEGIIKLRIYFDLAHDLVTIVPVTFPGWRIPKRKLGNVELFIDELGKGPLAGFMYIPSGFKKLSDNLKAEYLYILLVLRLSLYLAERFVRILRYGGLELQDLQLKRGDFLQTFGIEGGSVLYEAAQCILNAALESPRLFEEFGDIEATGQVEVGTTEPDQESLDLVAKEVLGLLRERMSECGPGDDLAKAGLSLSQMLESLASKHGPQIIKATLSRYMDTGLDGGCIKPFIIVCDDPTDPDFVICLRGYRLGEYGRGQDSIAYTDVQRARARTVGVLRYVMKRFASSEGNPVKGVIQDVMANKLFTNILHEWGRQRFECLHMEWIPFLYGPMIVFPETYGPQQAQHTLTTFGQATSAYITDWDDNRVVRGFRVIGEADDLAPHELFSEAETVYLDSLIEAYSLIAKELGEATAQPLMTLASCRNHRLTYIFGNKELDLWDEAARNLCTLLQVHATSQKPYEFLYEASLNRMADSLSQITDKLERYQTLKSLKERLLALEAPMPISRIIKQIADSLETEPVFDWVRPYPLRGLQKARELADAATLVIRNGLSTLGLAKDRRTEKQKHDQKTGEIKGLDYYWRRLELCAGEVEAVTVACEDFLNAVKSADRTSLGSKTEVIVRNVYEAMYRFAPIPEPERWLRAPIWPEEGPELRSYLESLSQINVALPGAFVCIDLRGTKDIPPKLAEIFDSGDPDYERLKLVALFGRIVERTAREYYTSLRKFITVTDSKVAIFADAEEAIEFASVVQSRIMQESYSAPVIGISWAMPKLVPGGALDSKSIEAVDLANISRKHKGKSFLMRRIFVNRELADKVRDPKMKECFRIDNEVPEIPGIDIVDFDWQKYLGLREARRP